MVFGAILGLVGAVAGGVQQSRAEKKAYRAQKESIELSKQYLLEGERLATPYLREMIAAIESAKQESLGYLGQAEYEGYRQVRDAYRQNAGRMDQSLARRGLYNSTTALAAQRGLTSQLARDTGQVGAAIGGMRSQVTMNAGRGIAAGNQSIADLIYRSRAGLAGIQGSVQYQAPQGLAASYGALGGQLGGAFDSWNSWRSKQGRTSAGGYTSAPARRRKTGVQSTATQFGMQGGPRLPIHRSRQSTSAGERRSGNSCGLASDDSRGRSRYRQSTSTAPA